MSTERPLPTEHDFNPHNDRLDAATAWQNFGGLTLDEAYARFCENPLYHQEDFMFMGGRAFAYYFPVVEKYLQNVEDRSPDSDDQEAWILAKCIDQQFRGDNVANVSHLKDRVIALGSFVCGNLQRFGADDAERQRVADAWSELAARVNGIAPSASHSGIVTGPPSDST